VTAPGSPAPKLPPLKLLAAAIAREQHEQMFYQVGPHGLCIHRSAAFVFDVPGASLVFGTFEPLPEAERGEGDSAVPFIHAWAEFRGCVFAPTTIERTGGALIAQNRAGYYAVNRAHDFRILTRPQLLRLDREFGLKRVLRQADARCKGGVSFGATLLNAALVDWKDSKDGGVIPAHVIEGVD
jgi:hypothetical protein